MSKTGLGVVPILLMNVLTFSSLTAGSGQAILYLPQPNGCHAIGTTTLVLRDRHRNHMSFTDADLLDTRFSRKSPPDYGAYERALLTVELTRSLVEEFLGKYLKHNPAPELDVPMRVDKK